MIRRIFLTPVLTVKFFLLIALTAATLSGCGGSSSGGGLPAAPPDPLPDGPVLSGTSADSSAVLSWSNLTDAEDYKVYVSTSGPASKSSTLVSGFPAPGAAMVSYVDQGLNNTTTYNYVVTVTIGGQESNVSNQFVANPFPQAVMLVGGTDFTCALRGNGTIWCWGANSSGQLGDGSTTDRYSPVQEVNQFTDWVDISVLASHACARRTGGTLYCWGNNWRNAAADSSDPTKVDPATISTANPQGYVVTPTQVDAAADWIDVSAGVNRTCGIKSSGFIFCWGGNEGATPVVQGALSNWAEVTAGGDSFCALNDLSQIFCWGGNGKGQLGNGVIGGSIALPTQEITGASDWTRVTMGYSHVCGLRGAGTGSSLSCWGWNEHGQVGNAMITTGEGTPIPVGSGSDWATVIAGYKHTCASKTTGELFCWGFNSNSQLGEGVTGDVAIPTLIGGVGQTDWGNLIAMGVNHTCVTKTDKKVYCWGRNDVGQIGNGTNTPIKNVPTRVGIANDWRKVETGIFHTCATKTDGTLWCAGNNSYGQLGTGNNNHSQDFKQVTANTDWADIAVGRNHTCAIRSGALYCWGDNISGALGINSTTNANAPTQEANGFTNWTEVTAGNSHTCAIRSGGALYCWGSNLFAQVGNGGSGFAAPNVLTPVRVGGTTLFDKVTAGTWATCARNGGLYCWGSNTTYAPNGFGRTTPGQVWSGTFSSFAVGTHIIGYDNDSIFKGIGTNTSGQLGLVDINGDLYVANNFTNIGRSRDFWYAPSASSNTSCAGFSNSLYCTGNNQYGQLGVGDFVDRWRFTVVDSGRNWKTAPSDYHTCGVTSNELYCWGWNREGQHGSGDAWVSIGSLVEVTN